MRQVGECAHELAHLAPLLRWCYSGRDGGAAGGGGGLGKPAGELPGRARSSSGSDPVEIAWAGGPSVDVADAGTGADIARARVRAFGALLRGHRRAAGLTQEALAERAGLSRRGLQHLEAGDARPHPATLDALAAALDLAPDERRGCARRCRPVPARPPRRPAGAPRAARRPAAGRPLQPARAADQLRRPGAGAGRGGGAAGRATGW